MILLNTNEIGSTTWVDGSYGVCTYILDGQCVYTWYVDDSDTNNPANLVQLNKTPYYKDGVFDVTLKSIKYNYSTLGFTLYFDLIYNHYESLNVNIIDNPQSGGYLNCESEIVGNYCIASNSGIVYNLSLEVFVNGVSAFTWNENELNPADDPVPYNQTYSLTFTNTTVNPSTENINIEFVITYDGQGQDVVRYTESETYTINSTISTLHTINLETVGETYTISNPISYDYVSQTYTYETIKITNETQNVSENVYGITEVITVEYNDPLNNTIITLNQPVTITVNMEGFDEAFTFNATWRQNETNSYTLVVDDMFHYDTSANLMMNGLSNTYQSFTDVLIMPLDYSNNQGTLSFNFQTSTYADVTYEITIPIGNINSYKGTANSQYVFEIGDDVILESWDYYFLIPESDFGIETITEEDLMRWIK